MPFVAFIMLFGNDATMKRVHDFVFGDKENTNPLYERKGHAWMLDGIFPAHHMQFLSFLSTAGYGQSQKCDKLPLRMSTLLRSNGLSLEG